VNIYRKLNDAMSVNGGDMAENRAKRSEVAKMAGVSEATVSFVLSKKRYVSDKLSKRVMAAVDELGYQPDFIARSMVTKTTETIVVLTSDIASPLQMEIIKSIQKEAMKKGFFVNVCGGTENLKIYIDNFIARRIDGLFLSVDPALVSDFEISRMLDKGISVLVTSARHIADDRVCGLRLDFEYGMDKIVEYLHGLKHTKIIYLSCFDKTVNSDNRIKGFKLAMKKHIGENSPEIICGQPPYESTIEVGYKLCKKLIESKKEFTAVICTNDLMAMGALEALREYNIQVPENVSVVGIDDIVFSKAFNPPLTTLSHMAKEYGKKIFDILYDNIQDKNIVRREVVCPEMIIRKSTAEVKSKNEI